MSEDRRPAPLLRPELKCDRWPSAWKPEDGQPIIRDADKPAVAQAIGRCYSARLFRGVPGAGVNPGRLHPRPCNWCDYPMDTLRQALGYARFHSKLNVLTSEYENPEWARFFQGETPATGSLLSPEEIRLNRRRRYMAINESMYGQIPLDPVLHVDRD